MNSPFSTRCPSELLVECFRFCTSSEVLDLDPDSAPIVLTRVCRRWREVALETPLLWSRFRLRQIESWTSDGGDAPTESNSPALRAFGLHLERSQSMPLTFFLQDSTQVGSKYYDPFLSRLLEEGHRWYDIAFRGPYKQSSFLVGGSVNTFPKLQSLQILDWPNDASTSLRPIFKNSPELRRVALKIPFISDCLKLMPSLSRLTTLKIWKTSNMTIAWRRERHEPQLFSILSHCTSLESLSIYSFTYSKIVFEPGAFDGRKVQQFVLPSLRFFSFPISDLDFPSMYLRALTLPNLTELQISPTGRLNLQLPRHREDIIDFARRHGTFGTIRKLTLGLPPSAELDFRLTIAGHFQSVVEIDLAEPEPYLTPWQGFQDGVVRYPSERWCKRNSNEWAEFVESRWRGSASVSHVDRLAEPVGCDDGRLKCLRMGVDAYACLKFVNETSLERIQRCVEEGFVLEPVHPHIWFLGEW